MNDRGPYYRHRSGGFVSAHATARSITRGSRLFMVEPYSKLSTGPARHEPRSLTHMYTFSVPGCVKEGAPPPPGPAANNPANLPSTFCVRVRLVGDEPESLGRFLQLVRNFHNFPAGGIVRGSSDYQGPHNQGDRALSMDE